MRFNSVLASSLLLVSAALAGRHDKHRRSQSLNPNNPRSTGDDAPISNPTFAGAILDMATGTFDSITGTVTVPRISGGSGDSVLIAVTIDYSGVQHCSPIMAGVGLDVGGNAQAFFQWSGNSYEPNLTISPEDEIQLSISMMGPQTAIAMVRNLANDQSAVQHLDSPNAYCGGAVGWGVSTNGDSTLASFSTVFFTDAAATGNGNTYQSSTGTGYIIEGKTTVATSDSSVGIRYVG